MKRLIVIGLLGAVALFLFFVFAVTRGELSKVQTQITTLEKDLSGVAGELSSAKSELALAQAELSSVKSENDKLRKGDSYNLRAHTYKEVMSFLAADLTNTKKYVKGEYTSEHFSRDVNNAAKEKGLLCAFVFVVYPDGKQSVLVAFQTIDAGLVFINPQDDKVMKVAKGVKYWRDNGYKTTRDDTIVEILILW